MTYGEFQDAAPSEANYDGLQDEESFFNEAGIEARGSMDFGDRPPRQSMDIGERPPRQSMDIGERPSEVTIGAPPAINAVDHENQEA